MRRTLWVGLMVVGLLGSVYAQNAREAAERVNRAYEAAFAKRDATAMAALYTSDAQVLAPDGEIVQGRAAIEQFWKKGLGAQEAVKIALKLLEFQEHGEYAHETGTYNETDSNGKIVSTGKYIVIWKKENGEWKMHRDIWNSPSAQ